MYSEDSAFGGDGMHTQYQTRKETLGGGGKNSSVSGQPRSFDSFIEEARAAKPANFSDERIRPGTLDYPKNQK